MAFAGKVALLQNDMPRFEKIYENFQKVLNRDGTVYEIYHNSDEHPHFQTWLYKSEAPFSWGSAYILDMESTYRRRQQQ